MTSDNQLQIVISAKTDGLTAATKDAKAAVADLSSAVQNQGAALKQTTTASASLGSSIGQVAVAATTGAKTMQQVAVATESAGHGTAGFYREVVVLGHEMVSGNFSRIPGSLMVMTERSGQLVRVFETLALAATPLGAAVVAVTASLGVMAYQAVETSRDLKQIETAMAAVGNGTAFNADRNKEYLAYLKEYGVSAKVATAALQDIEGAAHGNANEFTGLVKLLPTVTAMMRGDTAAAAKLLALAIDDPAKAIQILHDRYNALSPAQLQAARNFEDNGDRAQETAVVIQALKGRAADLHDQVEGKLSPAMTKLLGIWKLMVMVGNPFRDTLRGIGIAAGEAADAINSKMLAKNPNAPLKGPSDSVAAAQRENNALILTGLDLERSKGLEIARQEELQGQINQLKKAENAALVQGNTVQADRFAKDAAELQTQLTQLHGKGAGTQIADWQAGLDHMLSAQHAFGDKAKAEELAFWQQKLTIVKQGSAEYDQITSKIYQLQSEAAAKGVQASKKSSADTIRADAEVQQEKLRAAEADYSLEEQSIEIKHQLGQISSAQELQQLQKLKQQEYQLELKALQDEEKLWAQGSSEWTKVHNQILTLEKQYGIDSQKLTAQSVTQQQQKWTSFFGNLKSGFNSAMMGMVQGTQTFGQALGNVFLSMGETAFGVLEDIAEKWVVTQIVGDTASATSARAQIAGDAAVAGSAAFASTAAIPIVGPALAPAAGAAAYAGAMTYQASVPGFAVGAWQIPGDMTANIHKGEMILPAPFAESVRKNGGFSTGGGAGGDVHLHVHAVDAQSIQRLFKNNGAAIAASMKTAHRNFNPNTRGS